MLTNLREFRREADRVFSRSGAWTTGEVNKRIGLAFVTGCREEEDVKTDLPALLRGVIFVDLESAALRGAWNALDLAIVQDE